MTIEHWQVAVALICAPAAVMIVWLYVQRDKRQSEDNKQATLDRIGAAAFKHGADTTSDLVKHLHHELDHREDNETDETDNG